MNADSVYGAIEAGGTKFICAVGSGPERLLSETRIKTTTPDETLQQVIHFFRPAVIEGSIRRIGIGCFGPVDLDRQSSTYGFITSTPKPGWRNTDVVGRIQRELDVEVAFDMDVNASALGEFTWGAGQGHDALLYITIGTGIGGGYIIDGKPLKGLLSLEMGHVRIPHDRVHDPFPGSCPFHGDCFEGLANGPAIAKRFGIPGQDIPDNDPFWQIEAGYIALALQDFILTLSPRKIILGGGIMQREFLFPMIRQQVVELLNGYVQHPDVLEHVDDYIVPPGLGPQSGVLGAIALAKLLP